MERQASKEFYNKCAENSRSHIVFRTDIFRKLTLRAPDSLCEVQKFAIILKHHSLNQRLVVVNQMQASKSPKSQNCTLRRLRYFPYLYALFVTVLTLWVAPPKVFCNWYRIYWSRNQLWYCTHFRHPTDEQLRHVDIFFSNHYNLQFAHFECMDAIENYLWIHIRPRRSRSILLSTVLWINFLSFAWARPKTKQILLSNVFKNKLPSFRLSTRNISWHCAGLLILSTKTL